MSVNPCIGLLLVVLHRTTVTTVVWFSTGCDDSDDFSEDSSYSALPFIFGCLGAFMTIPSVIFAMHKWKLNQTRSNKTDPLLALNKEEMENKNKCLEETINQIQHLKGKTCNAESSLERLKRELETKNKQILNQKADNTNWSLALAEDLQQTKNKLKKKNGENINLQKEFNNRVAEVLQQLKDEQQRREKTENKTLQNLETRLENKNIKFEDKVAELLQQLQEEKQRRDEAEKNLQSLKKELETKNKELHEYNRKTLGAKKEETVKHLTERRDKSQQQLAKNVHPAVQNISQSLEELKATQIKMEENMATIRKLQKKFDHKVVELKEEYQKRQEAEKELKMVKTELENKNKELHDSKLLFESLIEKNEEVEKQLTELRDQHKNKLEKKLQQEQQRWEEVENLKKELENKKKELKTTPSDVSEL
ncbi:coiled-coil domain-containing protein 18-like isoform X2 [Channa argus]|uniref:coiled-coil domain-containing protein 18-like isoform X2 n=1 Tax=Channa argus TaxID=215402 RepID=UPI003521C89C